MGFYVGNFIVFFVIDVEQLGINDTYSQVITCRMCIRVSLLLRSRQL